MERPADQTLAAFLGTVAQATPAPGGGSAAAATCALAAALVEMAAGIDGRHADVLQRARAVRDRTLALSEEELSSYAPVLEARRLQRDDPRRSKCIEAALVEASRSPLEIAEAGAEAAELGLAVAAQCDPSIRGDAVAGVLLAEAAAATALGLVEVNLAEVGAAGEGLVARAHAAHERAARARTRALAKR